MIVFLEALNHSDTRMTFLSERELMRTPEGGCTIPIGINTKLKSDSLCMRGLVCSLDGQRMIEYQEAIQFKDAKSREERENLAEELGVIMATKNFHHGADKILKELAHRTPL